VLKPCPRARRALPRRRLHADRVPAARRQVQGLRHRPASTAATGTSSTSGASSHGRRDRPSAPTRWRTTRTRRASSCSTSASPRPPPGSRDEIPPGKMSSWVFNLKKGDKVTVFGPFGEFFARTPERDGLHRRRRRHGADALAHLRPVQAPAQQAQDQLLVRRALDARGLLRRGVRQARRREPRTSSGTSRCPSRCPRTTGPATTGFIHNVLYENYLKDHPAPEDCEYYMCGPPMMNAAVIKMLLDLGVEPREHHAGRLRRLSGASKVRSWGPPSM
jgi:hypothetical protein